MQHRRRWTRFLRLAHYHGLIPHAVLMTGLQLIRLMWPPENNTPREEQP